MAAITTAVTAIGAIGSLVSTVGAIGSADASARSAQQQADAQAEMARAEGKAAQQSAAFEARQLRQRAGQDRATSQLQSIEEQRRARLARSRAQAIAAASGGGTGGSVANIMARLQAEGDWNSAVALYEGEDSARGLELQAKATQSQGDYARRMGEYSAGNMVSSANYAARNLRRAGYMSAAGNLMSTGASFYSKYWPTDEGGTTMEGTYGLQPLTGGPGRTRYNYG